MEVEKSFILEHILPVSTLFPYLQDYNGYTIILLCDLEKLGLPCTDNTFDSSQNIIPKPTYLTST